jgi:DNA polymerase zeta
VGKHLDILIGKLPNKNKRVFKDEYGIQKQSGINVPGRIIINLWRIIRKEINLRNYNYQNVIFNLLNVRIHEFSHETLTKYLFSKNPSEFSIAYKYNKRKTEYNLHLLTNLDIINRTAERARVYGIDFFSCISRGSQYFVEGMLIRLTKPRNYFVLSPSKTQVQNQNSNECIPLVMNPESGLYIDPVLVLDFQSLYPRYSSNNSSIMIAYNLCYCTCLGKLGSNKFGAYSQFNLEEGALKNLIDDIFITPNGVMFLKPSIRYYYKLY